LRRIRRWVASPWGMLLLLGVLVILIVVSVKLVHRYSPEGRLRSYVPESIRETCTAGSGSFEGGGSVAAIEGHPTAKAGLFCGWEGHSPAISNTVVFMTYLLFSDRESLLDAFPSPPPTNCLTDEAGRRICFDPHYFGTFGEIQHVVWTDGRLVLTDAMVAGAVYGWEPN
jgi:hypothetical protein